MLIIPRALGRHSTEEWLDLPTGGNISGSWYHWLRSVMMISRIL